MNLSDLRSYWAIANVQAMARTVREKESNQTDAAYTIINGGSHFTAPPWAHPWHGIPTTKGAKASGAYQHLGTTWASLAQRYGIPDFSPPNQDAGFVGGLVDRNALEDVIAGRFEEAVAKLRKEWTSLPGAAESRGDWTMDKAKAVFRKYGGGIANERDPRPDIPSAPLPAPASQSPFQQEGTRMGGLAAAGFIGQLLQTVVQAFAPAARAKVEEAAGKVTDPSGAKSLADALMGVVQKVTGIADPIQATAAVTAATPQSQALLAKVQQESLDYLDKLSPWVDKIAAAEQANWKANDDSADRAAARWANVKDDIAPALVSQANILFVATLIGVAILVGLQVWLNNGTVDSGTYALLSVLVYGVVRMADRPSAHRFGGAYDSAAVNSGSTVINQTIEERRNPKP